MRLMIADDSPVFKKRLIQLLSEIQGLDLVYSAADGVDALSAARRLRPDVMILDIQMPGASGIEVLRDIKRDHPEIVVIMLTSYGEPQYRKRCLDLGANYFFSKSTDSKDLFGLIQGLERDDCGKSDKND